MPTNKIILGIVGENASGKTTVTEYLHKKYGAASFRFSDSLTDILKRLYLENTRANLQTLSTILRQNFSEDILSRVIAEDVKNSTARFIITEGVRRPSDVSRLKNIPGFYLIALTADERVRFERLLKRGEKPDDGAKTWEEFQAEGKQEPEQKIKEVALNADFQIDNNGTLDQLHSQLDAVIAKLRHES